MLRYTFSCETDQLNGRVSIHLKNALLFLTHMWSKELESEFAAMSLAKGVEPWLLTDSRNPELKILMGQYQRCHVFDVARLAQLPYTRIGTCDLCGHGHFPLLDFYLAHPEFENYWVVEYDVRYTGDWARFFARFDRFVADLLTTHVRRFVEEPYWYWWRTFRHPDIEVPMSEYIRSFNVIYRISARALRFLDQELRLEWRGHHEVLMATLLYRNGFTVMDLGGDGSFTPPRLRNRAYLSSSSEDGSLGDGAGTVCYRPTRVKAGPLRNKLYHPVKAEGGAGGFKAFVRASEYNLAPRHGKTGTS